MSDYIWNDINYNQDSTYTTGINNTNWNITSVNFDYSYCLDYFLNSYPCSVIVKKKLNENIKVI